MTQYYRNTSLALKTGVAAFVNVATGKARGKTLGNVTLANTATGATANLTVTYLSQRGVEVDTVPPGQTLYSPGVAVDDITVLADANATIALDVRYPESLPPQSLTVTGGTITLSGVVQTDIGQQVDGAIDPRNIRTLTSADQPDVTANASAQLPTNLATDSVGLAKAAQLPAALDAGALQVAVEKPLYKAGVIDVHDTGA